MLLQDFAPAAAFLRRGNLGLLDTIRPGIVGGMDQRAVDGVLRRDLGGVALYSVAFLLAFASAWASVVLSAALAVFFALTVRISPPAPRAEPGLAKGLGDLRVGVRACDEAAEKSLPGIGVTSLEDYLTVITPELLGAPLIVTNTG